MVLWGAPLSGEIRAATPQPETATSPPEPLSATALEKLFLDAQKARQEGRYKTAFELLQQLYNADPQGIYLANMARVRKQQGLYKEADRLLDRAINHTLDEKDLELALKDKERLKSKLGKAWLGVTTFPGDQLLQLDNRVLLSRGEDVPIDAGMHLVCATGEGNREASCARRNLYAGRLFPLPVAQPVSGVVKWRPTATIDVLKMSGSVLHLDLQKLETLRLDAGTYQLEVRTNGGLSRTFEVRLTKGQTYDLGAKVDAWMAEETESLQALNPAPWVFTGLGVVIVGVGVGLLVTASQEHDDILTPKDPEVQTSAQTRWNEANDVQRAGQVVLGLGAASAVAGIIWGIVDLTSKSERQVTLAPMPCVTGGGCGLTLGGTF